MTRTELAIQLLKVAIGLALGAYFLWWSLEVLDRLTPKDLGSGALPGIPCPKDLSCDLVWIRPSDRFELLQPTCEAQRARRDPGREPAQGIHSATGRLADAGQNAGRSHDYLIRPRRHQSRRAGLGQRRDDQTRPTDAALIPGTNATKHVHLTSAFEGECVAKLFSRPN